MSNNSGYKNIYYRYKRFFVFSAITLFALIIPYITINGNHFFLLSFERKQLHLLFASFATQELFLMPFVLIFFFIFIFFVTTLGGRIWCGWGCPQTIFRTIYRDLIQTKLLKIRKTLNDKQKPAQTGVKFVIGLILFACVSLVAASNFLWFFVPPEDFFAYISDPLNHTGVVTFVFAVALALFLDVTVLAEKFCVYVCPYARVQSVMFDEDTIQVIYDEGRGGKIYDGHTKLWKKPQIEGAECVGCEACVRTCPTHIDIRKGMQLECINCLECADACSNTMGRLGKKSLINWTSKKSLDTRKPVNFFRFRTIGYIGVLGFVLVLLAFMTTKIENMLLNVNRDSDLYAISKQDGKLVVENNYIFMIENTDSNEHRYSFEIDNPNIEIIKPKEPQRVGAGKKRKIIVIMRAKTPLPAQNSAEDNVIKLDIHAFADDKKDEISIHRPSIFIYPNDHAIAKVK